MLSIATASFVSGCGMSFARMRDTTMTRVGEWSYGGWLTDYEIAEDRAKETDRPLLVFYKRRGVGDDIFKEALSTVSHSQDGSEYVRCVLSSALEPDRRYVAQFGVDRTPAVIVVHRDGTFHAQSGRFSPSDAVQFAETSTAPGLSPKLNPFLAKRPDYAWYTSLRDAGLHAANTGQPLLIAYERRLSRDGSQLAPLLKSTDVRRKLDDMVPCRLTVWNSWSDPYDSPFGMLHLPAIIIVWPDGQSDILQRPVSTEAIVRFVDNARKSNSEKPARVVGAEADLGFPPNSVP